MCAGVGAGVGVFAGWDGMGMGWIYLILIWVVVLDHGIHIRFLVAFPLASARSIMSQAGDCVCVCVLGDWSWTGVAELGVGSWMDMGLCVDALSRADRLPSLFFSFAFFLSDCV